MAVGGYLVIIIQSYMTVIEEQYPISSRPTADKFDDWAGCSGRDLFVSNRWANVRKILQNDCIFNRATAVENNEI